MSLTFLCAACGGPYVAADELTAEAFTAALLAVVCGHCLGFVHRPGPLVTEDYDRDRLHEQLRRLDHLVGRLPVHKRWRHEVFHRDLPLETLVEAVRVAGDVPNIPTIRRHHDSWAAALTDAGVARGARENMFGTQSRALDGHMCYSLGELLIDDWLTHHEIPHDREPPYLGTDLRGDFLVRDTIIEFFGLAGRRDYDAIADRKRQLAREHGLSLLEISREDVETWEYGGATLLAQHLGITPRATLPPPPSVGTAPPIGRYETRAQRRQRTRTPLGEPVRAPGWATDPFGVGACRYTDGRVWTRWIKTTAGKVALHTPTVRPEVARHAWELMDDEDRRYELFELAEELAGMGSELLEWYLAWIDAAEMHVPKFLAQIYADGGIPWSRVRPWRDPYRGAARFFAAAGHREAELAVWMRAALARGTDHDAGPLLARGYQPDETGARMVVPL